ncbi:hypothetical protein ACFXAF_16585 [Kitasatospora sp. NPDC059463]|uniref:hypothetical protein n=1 Tax=unclassified Kitasatospora TaxID=2633591 RepID=UPI0036B99184
MNAPPTEESGCELLKRTARDLKKDIDRSVQRAAEIRARITALQAQADPDQAQIDTLRQALEVLEKKIEDERASLSNLNDVISENCGP